LNTLTATKGEEKTRLETSTYVSTATATETATEKVAETALSECLGKVYSTVTPLTKFTELPSH
jgi:hypothetical protein